MKNTTLLSSIFEDTKNLITSSEFKEAYSLGNSFSRNRKLSFSNTILWYYVKKKYKLKSDKL